ncbi:MAG: dehydrogenase [Candidatus Hydrogenedentota bacterium]
MNISRRKFIGSSAAAVIVAGTMAKGKVFGANGRVNIGCIGLNSRGQEHMGALCDTQGAQITALCDVDERVLSDRVNQLRIKTGGDIKPFTDMRVMFEEPSIDAITIATPNHWHTLAAIWALQAGKHVYVEKPLCHNVWEGRQLVNLAKKSGKIVQHGTQARSETKWLQTIRHLRDGVIGDIYMARALCYKRRDSIGFAPFEAPPKELHWDIWQGPAERAEFCKNYVHYNWHWFWAYGNGDIGNQGVHQMDVAIWGLNKGLPTRVYAAGGRYGYKDQAETPNTELATFTYADGATLAFEVRGRATNFEADTRIGNLFYGSEGYFIDGDEAKEDNQYRFVGNNDKTLSVKDPGVKTEGCWQNFVTAVLSGKEEDNFAPASEGFIASAHGHLANISYRLGRALDFDPATERFVNDDEANAMLTRHYHPDFTVPEIT